MAKTVIERITDDLDGSDNATTVSFGLDGISYAIDLGSKNENALRTLLKPYIEGGRRVRTETTRATRGAARGADKDRNANIRTWALQQGIQLPSRGRIAGSVQEAYDAQDIAALFAAVGLEMEPAKPKRGRGRAAEFSAAAA